jgi:hypothetical protein
MYSSTVTEDGEVFGGALIARVHAPDVVPPCRRQSPIETVVFVPNRVKLLNVTVPLPFPVMFR